MATLNYVVIRQRKSLKSAVPLVHSSSSDARLVARRRFYRDRTPEVEHVPALIDQLWLVGWTAVVILVVILTVALS